MRGHENRPEIMVFPKMPFTLLGGTAAWAPCIFQIAVCSVISFLRRSGLLGQFPFALSVPIFWCARQLRSLTI